jgi:hypothetical protein
LRVTGGDFERMRILSEKRPQSGPAKAKLEHHFSLTFYLTRGLIPDRILYTP